MTPAREQARPFVAGIATPVLLVVSAVALLASGDAAPRWIWGLGGLWNVAPSSAVRGAAAILVAIALCAVVIARWRRGIARLGLVVLAFMALATSSSALGVERSALIVSIACLVASLVLFSMLRGAAPSRGADTIGDAWRVFAIVAIGTAVFALIAACPMRDTSGQAPLPRRARGPATAGAIDLEMNRWEGNALRDTELAVHLPALADQLGDGVTFLILYSPRCGHCHELFASRFAGHIDERVIAIRIPIAADESTLETDQPDDITCPECVRMSLPTGPLWIVTPPAVVRVEHGTVTCVSEPPAKTDCFAR